LQHLTLMKTFSRFSAMITASSPRAAHFSSDQKYGFASTQASRSPVTKLVIDRRIS
jgi:hypothetical protein